jgi:cold shock CspA family protein
MKENGDPRMREKKPPAEAFGTVTRLLPEQGFGWIRGDAAEGETGEDYFFHARAVRGAGFDENEKFFEGARVRFIATDSPKGPRALNVVALGEEGDVDGNVALPLPKGDPSDA